jgi:hypothetical protein
VEPLFTASLHLSDFVQTQNEAKILTLLFWEQFTFSETLCICLKYFFYVYPLSFCDKKGEYFLFWTGNVFPNKSSVFCPRMAKGGVY